jgi:hypothetical protein
MNDIVLITPPDVLYNDTYSILIITPSIAIKNSLHEILKNTVMPINVYLFSDGDSDIAWLCNVLKMSNITIFDLDNANSIVKEFSSYIIAQPKTFYLTVNQNLPYNLISKNRVYDFAWLENILFNRGKNE